MAKYSEWHAGAGGVDVDALMALVRQQTKTIEANRAKMRAAGLSLTAPKTSPKTSRSRSRSPAPKRALADAVKWKSYTGYTRTSKSGQLEVISLRGGGLGSNEKRECKSRCARRSDCAGYRVRNPKKGRTKCVLYRNWTTPTRGDRGRDYMSRKIVQRR